MPRAGLQLQLQLQHLSYRWPCRSTSALSYQPLPLAYILKHIRCFCHWAILIFQVIAKALLNISGMRHGPRAPGETRLLLLHHIPHGPVRVFFSRSHLRSGQLRNRIVSQPDPLCRCRYWILDLPITNLKMHTVVLRTVIFAPYPYEIHLCTCVLVQCLRFRCDLNSQYVNVSL